MHPRQRARAIVVAALPAVLVGFTYRPAAYRPGDLDSLPVYEVATPRTDISREAAFEELQEIRIEVVLRLRGGDDVFDRLDDLCQPVEGIVLAALAPEFPDTDLDRVETAIASDGPEPVGLMLLTFTTRARVAAGNPQEEI